MGSENNNFCVEVFLIEIQCTILLPYTNRPKLLILITKRVFQIEASNTHLVGIAIK